MRRPALPPWWQVRCLLRAPLPVGPGHTVSGTLRFEANESRGYNLHIELTNESTGVSSSNTVVTQCALHHFQYTSQQSVPYDMSYGAGAAPASPSSHPPPPAVLLSPASSASPPLLLERSVSPTRPDTPGTKGGTTHSESVAPVWYIVQ